MVTFFILCFVYCLLLPMLYLWWERRKIQKDIPVIIHESLNGFWTDNEALFDAINKMSNWNRQRLIYHRMYNEDLTEVLHSELNMEELNRCENIIKTRNNETVANFIKNNF